MSKSAKWFLGILAVLLVVGGGATLLFALMFMSMTSDSSDFAMAAPGDKVAMIELKGTIVSSDEMVRQFKRAHEDRSVRAIVFRVESPGGGVAASQEIYEEVRKTRTAGIPIVVSMGSVAASGGYYVSCGGSTIVANPGTLTGSIGVIAQFMRFDPMLDKVGVRVTTIKSGKLKDSGSPFREMTKEDKEYFQALMDTVHLQFIHVVESERRMEHSLVAELADGRVFTGADARRVGLVDTLGTYEDAILIAARLGGIRGKPALLRIRERPRVPWFFNMLTGLFRGEGLLSLKDEILDQPILQYRMPQGF